MDATSPPEEAPGSPVANDSDEGAHISDEDAYDSDKDAYDSDEEAYDSDQEIYEEDSDECLDILDDEENPIDPDARRLELYSERPHDIEELMVYSSHADMHPVRASLQSPFASAPTSGLGKLERLPVEINIMVLHQMDLLTFFRFRQINLRARELANTVKEYTIIAKHALEAVRALLRARVGNTFTVDSFYLALLTHDCAACGKFGSLLSLATSERCCISCIRYSDRFHVLSRYRFCKGATITPEVLDRHTMVRLRPVPGRSDEVLKRIRGYPSNLIPVGTTAQALLDAGVIDQSAHRILQKTKCPLVHRLMTTTPFPSYDPNTDTIERGVCCTFCRTCMEDTLHAPWTEEYESDEMGVDIEVKRLIDIIDIFSRREFLAHLKDCDAEEVMDFMFW